MDIVQEKMDGSNVCIVRVNGELKAVGRSGYDCSNSDQEQHHMFYRYMLKHKEYFERLLPNDHDRLVGEWCALAHGTIYKDLEVPFWPFDLYLNKVQQSVDSLIGKMRDAGDYHSFCKIPIILSMGHPVSIEEALQILDNNRPEGEGVVYRFEVRGKPHMIAKVVKMDKRDGKYFKDENNVTIDKSLYTWNWRDDDNE